jgi:hypothetical protein
MMLAFDMPIPFNTMGRRSVSNVPAQALILMNHPLVLQQAERWAESLLASDAATEERILRAFEMAFGHAPSEAQLSRAREFIAQQASLHECGEADLRVWKDLCHTLLNMKEFIYVN